ncbi:pilus assembly protein HofM [Izhakiella capsodis]|uniref:Pilus assembly protein HofM n=1 Tax=Izhakiella capsodis TaxID=1367852 RepID=A0A1I4YZI2_9GAMM|nr:pilus assembly protein PilM [Izhakiella capsodis]SFN43425.1 pilus assembly protein HofM [Izhakiella capsodis]
MAFKRWNIGLDIQNGQLCALAVQRHRRKGLQLRHWWHFPLPADTLVQGIIQRSESLITLLSTWRQSLPCNVSLRVGLHPQLVLQRQLALPAAENRLRESERSRYINAAARRFFPIDIKELVVDYRQHKLSGEICLTAAHRSALDSWNDCLQAAGLFADVMELTPAALVALAEAMKLPAQASLVHALSDHWLWFSPQKNPATGWCPRSDVNDLQALVETRLAANRPIFISDAINDRTPAPEYKTLNPFSLFGNLQPPFPQRQQSFVLAAGLALRQEDHSWYG